MKHHGRKSAHDNVRSGKDRDDKKKSDKNYSLAPGTLASYLNVTTPQGGSTMALGEPPELQAPNFINVNWKLNRRSPSRSSH